MGRLIDSEYLKEDMKRYGWEHVDSTVTEYVDGLDIVEAIPKSKYETRLKADLVAILTEIQVEIGEHINPSNHTDSYEDGWSEGAEWCIDYIQEKINSLKEK